MILIIDNYDSFTYNIVHIINKLGFNTLVYRNDKINIDDIYKLSPTHIIISPGPKTPDYAGISKKIVSKFVGEIPILGICLGHQCIASVFGFDTVRAKKIMHGKTSLIHHDSKTIYKDIPTPFIAMRYNSLIVKSVDSPLIVSATSECGEIMGVRHQKFLLEGVQFHPDSVLTRYGEKLLQNFLELEYNIVNKNYEQCTGDHKQQQCTGNHKQQQCNGNL